MSSGDDVPAQGGDREEADILSTTPSTGREPEGRREQPERQNHNGNLGHGVPHVLKAGL